MPIQERNIEVYCNGEKVTDIPDRKLLHDGWQFEYAEPDFFPTMKPDRATIEQVERALTSNENIKMEDSMKYQDVKILKRNGGFIVQVGCEDFVFTDTKAMTEAIKLYYDNPEKAKEKYIDGAKNG